MKTRTMTIILTTVLVILFGSQTAYGAEPNPATVSALLEDKLVYHTEDSDYIDGDCVLTSTKMMIRRAAIMKRSDSWAGITNASLRDVATADGLMHNSFSYSGDGITYNVSTGEFTGEDSAARVSEFAKLLEEHPEGIVVFGMEAAETGPHGVLVVKVEDGEVYAVDSALNKGDLNKGIQKWKDTIMLDPSLCTDYWYLSDISGSSKEWAKDPGTLKRSIPMIPDIKFI